MPKFKDILGLAESAHLNFQGGPRRQFLLGLPDPLMEGVQVPLDGLVLLAQTGLSPAQTGHVRRGQGIGLLERLQEGDGIGLHLDGSDDRVLFTVPRSQAHFSNLHLSWPSRVNGWFVAGFFPSAAGASTKSMPSRARATPPTAATSDGPGYEPPLDEILLIHLDGTTKYLARTGTVYSAPAGRGRSGDMFWAQTLPSPSADGKRIYFNSNRSGTIDLCLLFLDPAER